MRKFLLWTGCTILVLVTGLYVTILLRQNRVFAAPYPAIHASRDSGVIARGEKLVFGAAHCAECHSPEKMDPVLAKGGKPALSGGRAFKIPVGTIYTRNLTTDESGIKNLSDGEIARALRYGVSASGHALYDFMPFHSTSDEDLTAIISWLRQQQPVKNEVPENTFNLLGKTINAFVLKPVGPSEAVPVSVPQDTTAIYGKYLARSIANCRGCHTNRDMTGAFIGEEFAGGLKMEAITDSGKFELVTPSLRPDRKGRIRGFSEDQFVARFRKGKTIPQSHMPWISFSRIKKEELSAIYKYLQTLPPVH